MWRIERPCWKKRFDAIVDDPDGIVADAKRADAKRAAAKRAAAKRAANSDGADDDADVDTTAPHKHSPYSFDDLVEHINKFDSDPKILDELGCCVESNYREVLELWFKGLKAGWSDTMTPGKAIRLVKYVLEKVHNNYVFVADLQGFSLHYGLPSFLEINITPAEMMEDSLEFEKLIGPALENEPTL